MLMKEIRMVRTWPAPRVFVYLALGAAIAGIGLLYANLKTVAPLFLLAGVVASVLAVIATTVADIEQAEAVSQDAADPAVIQG